MVLFFQMKHVLAAACGALMGMAHARDATVPVDPFAAREGYAIIPKSVLSGTGGDNYDDGATLVRLRWGFETAVDMMRSLERVAAALRRTSAQAQVRATNLEDEVVLSSLRVEEFVCVSQHGAAPWPCDVQAPGCGCPQAEMLLQSQSVDLRGYNLEALKEIIRHRFPDDVVADAVRAFDRMTMDERGVHVGDDEISEKQMFGERFPYCGNVVDTDSGGRKPWKEEMSLFGYLANGDLALDLAADFCLLSSFAGERPAQDVNHAAPASSCDSQSSSLQINMLRVGGGDGLLDNPLAKLQMGLNIQSSESSRCPPVQPHIRSLLVEPDSQHFSALLMDIHNLEKGIKQHSSVATEHIVGRGSQETEISILSSARTNKVYSLEVIGEPPANGTSTPLHHHQIQHRSFRDATLGGNPVLSFAHAVLQDFDHLISEAPSSPSVQGSSAYNFLNLNLQTYDCVVLEAILTTAKSRGLLAFDAIIIQTNVHFPPPVRYQLQYSDLVEDPEFLGALTSLEKYGLPPKLMISCSLSQQLAVFEAHGYRLISFSMKYAAAVKEAVLAEALSAAAAAAAPHNEDHEQKVRQRVQHEAAAPHDASPKASPISSERFHSPLRVWLQDLERSGSAPDHQATSRQDIPRVDEFDCYRRTWVKEGIYPFLPVAVLREWTNFGQPATHKAHSSRMLPSMWGNITMFHDRFTSQLPFLLDV